MSEPDEPQQAEESGEPSDTDETPHRRESSEPMVDVWTPVVYGRTRRADRWWRAVPVGADREWLAAAVTGVTAGGRGLEHGPRFLLAQNRSSRLVGVACRAAALSASMNSDGSRPLYCFVGWCAPLARAVGEAPALAELREHYVRWAAPVYEEWMRADWEVHPSRLHQSHEPPPGPAPWPWSGTGPAPDVQNHHSMPGWPWYWPTDEAEIPWRMAAYSEWPCVVSLGWRRARDAQAPTGARSDIAADDIRELSQAPRPVPPSSHSPSGTRGTPGESGRGGPPPYASPTDRDPHPVDRLSDDPHTGRAKGWSGMASVPPALRPTPPRGVPHQSPTETKAARLPLPPEPTYSASAREGSTEEHGSPEPRADGKDKPPSWPPMLNPWEWARRVKRLGTSAGDRHPSEQCPED